MKSKKYGIMLAVLAAAGGVNASAAPVPVYELKGLTVTATRQAETTKDVPANVQIVTEKEIKARNVQNAAQAVALATGVQVDTTVEGSVNLRGYNSKNILVLVDGQQMNTAWNSTVDWNMIPVENIRKVEVVSGGQSALYGGRAVGGVINIMTKSAKENGVHGAVNLGYGSHNTVKQSYMASGRKDRLNWGIFYESKITDGWRSYLSSYAIKNSKGKNNFTGVDTSSLDTTADGKEYIIGDRGMKEVMSESYGFNLGYDLQKTESSLINSPIPTIHGNIRIPVRTCLRVSANRQAYRRPRFSATGAGASMTCTVLPTMIRRIKSMPISA